ncbi:MAG TPA: ABC transporter permease [Thermoanaerobaculia bacterium]|jgi:simple sugar transport system permease protein|nr:ABC transporter permease [Thermoanaerobaculia bacterium]
MSIILILLLSAIRLATPLLLAALGGLYSERSGVINIALEGLLLAGAFTAATATHYTGSPWIGLAAAILAGILVALLHGVACIKFKADQVVSGTAINILFLGVPALLSGAFFESTGATPQLPQGQLMPYTPIVLAFLLVPVTWYVLNRTRFGLRLRAVGENPEAADTAGVDVARVRFLAVMLSGALAAIGGAYLSIGQSSLFARNMSAGRGFIALAALIFGKWRPVQTMLACLLFGLAEALSIQMQGVSQVPVQFIQIVPYVLTIVVLAGFIGQSRAPRALGIPYQEKR